MDFSTQKIVVTGAASGLGRATAQVLRDAGAQVAILDRDASGHDVADAMGATFQSVDVTDEASVKAAVTGAAQAMGGLTGAVNCAGIATGETTLGRDGPMPLANFKRTVDINLVGSFNIARDAAEIMAENAPDPDGLRGVIVNTASVAAFEGQRGQTAYASSKGGIVGLTLPLARDLARSGIRAMAIAPGIFRTPMLEGLGEEVMDGLAQDVVCPKRLGHPSEFGDLVKFIISAPYLNGSVIRLDGAIRLP